MLKGIITVFSFFTAIPMPFIEWDEERIKYITPLIWFVGLVIGGISLLLIWLLELMDLSPFYSAIIVTVYYTMITGGLHVDGLMDSADAYFSQRDLARRLEIMKDSRVGAFAVMAFVVVTLVKVGTIREVFLSGPLNPLLVIIPVMSRLLVSLLICLVGNATEGGMTALYKKYVKSSTPYILYGVLCLVIAIIAFVRWQLVFMLLPLLVFFIGYIVFCQKVFGGITGDLLGAFLELSEVVLWISYLGVIKLWF